MNHDDPNPGAALSPELLLKLLEAARAALPLEDHFREAGTLAWKITVLRQACERQQFEDTSLEAYASRLSDSMSFDLQPVLEWFGLARLTWQAPVRALCRFAKGLGIPPLELYAKWLHSLADNQRLPVPAAPHGDGPDGRTYVERCVNIMEGLNWNSESRAAFNHIRREIYLEFGERDS